MPRAFTPKIVSANHLLDGDVVYLTAAGGWTRALAEAAVADTEADAEALAAAADQPGRVVGPYLADVTLGADGPRPTHFREAFRASGPSIPLPGPLLGPLPRPLPSPLPGAGAPSEV